MVLKIFVKKRAHGELCTDEFEYSKTFHEAAEITQKEVVEKGNLKTVIFSLKNTDGETWITGCSTNTHGYEILNDKGIVIERYVSAIRDSELPKKKFTEEQLTSFGNFLLQEKAEKEGVFNNPENSKLVTQGDYMKWEDANRTTIWNQD